MPGLYPSVKVLSAFLPQHWNQRVLSNPRSSPVQNSLRAETFRQADCRQIQGSDSEFQTKVNPTAFLLPFLTTYFWAPFSPHNLSPLLGRVSCNLAWITLVLWLWVTLKSQSSCLSLQVLQWSVKHGITLLGLIKQKVYLGGMSLQPQMGLYIVCLFNFPL